VDESWLPAGATQARLRDLLESELGLPRRATVEHLVDRIELIAEGTPEDDAAKRLNLISAGSRGGALRPTLAVSQLTAFGFPAHTADVRRIQRSRHP
jgi:hypothetical protein